jgi:hypothetical protein
MLIYVKKKKNFLRTDGQTDGQPKTIVRNLTTYIFITFLHSTQNICGYNLNKQA